MKNPTFLRTVIIYGPRTPPQIKAVIAWQKDTLTREYTFSLDELRHREEKAEEIGECKLEYTTAIDCVMYETSQIYARMEPKSSVETPHGASRLRKEWKRNFWGTFKKFTRKITGHKSSSEDESAKQMDNTLS
jgi:hypothetical protein